MPTFLLPRPLTVVYYITLLMLFLEMYDNSRNSSIELNGIVL